MYVYNICKVLVMHIPLWYDWYKGSILCMTKIIQIIYLNKTTSLNINVYLQRVYFITSVTAIAGFAVMPQQTISSSTPIAATSAEHMGPSYPPTTQSEPTTPIEKDAEAADTDSNNGITFFSPFNENQNTNSARRK